MAPIPIADPVAHLAGTWDVVRQLEDRHDDVRGTFRGTAAFVPDGAGLRWSEEGVLCLGRYAGPARRELAIVPAGDGWEVRFADGRPFHPLALTTGRAEVEHPCGEDHYAGAYESDGPDVVLVRWDVTGPRADATILTRYTRQAPARGRPSG